MTMIAITAALLLMLLLWATGGPGVGGDGQAMLEMASNIKHGRGFVDLSMTDAVHFPPGPSLMVAVLAKLGLSWKLAVALINTTAWVASIMASGVIFKTIAGYIRSWQVLAVLGVGVSGAMLMAHAVVASEPAFIAISLWLLIHAERWISQRRWIDGLTVWVLCAALISVRYVGVCLVAAIAIRALQERRAIGQRLTAALIVLSSMTPMLIWYFTFSTASRNDAPSESGVAVSLANVPHSLGALSSSVLGLPYSRDDTILAARIDPALRVVLALLGTAIALAACFGIAKVLMRRYRSSSPAAGSARSLKLLIIDYVVIYSVFMLFYRILSGYSILARYWLAIVVPSIVALAANEAANRRAALNRWMRLAALALVIGNFVISVGLVLHSASSA